ncbi:MAG: aldo/keto reductase [Phycisphaerae bacterium]|nr:aldo/keto reductase [Phycisphaerae bacterium]
MSSPNPESVQGLTRRQFVRAAGASSALALAQSVGEAAEAENPPRGKGPESKLPTRVLGKTGLRVSTIAYGSYNLSNPKLLDAAMNEGITLVVTSNDYQNGAAERTIGEIMARRRKQVVLGTGKSCTRRTTTQDLLQSIDQSLKRLQTDHVDMWRVHHVNDADVLGNEAIYEAFDKAKQAGKVGHLGLSTHSSPATGKVVAEAIKRGRFEFLMAKYNFMEFPEDYVPFKNAADAGMGVIVFKVDAGRRDKAVAEMQQLKDKLKISGDQARIKWALQNKLVASVVSGERSFEGIREACQAAMTPLSRADRQYLDAYVRRFQHEYCRYCGQCVAACPHGVQVDDVMRFVMYFKHYQAEKAAMQEYAAMPQEKRAATCAHCSGPCMAACPNGVRVQPQLAEAHRLLTMDVGTDRHV